MFRVITSMPGVKLKRGNISITTGWPFILENFKLFKENIISPFGYNHSPKLN